MVGTRPETSSRLQIFLPARRIENNGGVGSVRDKSIVDLSLVESWLVVVARSGLVAGIGYGIVIHPFGRKRIESNGLLISSVTAPSVSP